MLWQRELSSFRHCGGTQATGEGEQGAEQKSASFVVLSFALCSFSKQKVQEAWRVLWCLPGVLWVGRGRAQGHQVKSRGTGIYREPMGTPLAIQNMEDICDHQPMIHNAWLSHSESQIYRWFSQIINQTWVKKGDGINTALLNVFRQPISAQTVKKNGSSYRHPLQWQIAHTCLSYV